MGPSEAGTPDRRHGLRRAPGSTRAWGPEDTAGDHRGEDHCVGETVAVRLVGEDRDGQRHATPGQHAHQALLPQRTHQTRARHRRAMADDRAPHQTEAAVGGEERITRPLWLPLAVTQDAVACG
jgi:hypothetical protein